MVRTPASFQPAVSVLLPTRDSEATLSRAIESIVDQTLEAWELIIVDDHSRDGSREIAERFAENDKRIRLVPNRREAGLVGALQTALDAARSEFLARMDADDWSAPERLERQLALMRQMPCLAVCGCGVRIVGTPAGQKEKPAEAFRRYEEWLSSLVNSEAIHRERFIESPLVHPSVMMRRSALEAVGGYKDPPWAEDYDLWLRMLDAGMRLAKTREILFEWQDGPKRLTRTDPRYSLRAFQTAKAHYLARMESIRQRGVMINGGGPTGKTFARLLGKEGVDVHAFVDIHPGRIGRTLGGVPIVGVESIPHATKQAAPVQLAAVGQPGRRDHLRTLLEERGYREGHDYWCVA